MKYTKEDLRVSRILWFFIGFAAAMLLMELKS